MKNEKETKKMLLSLLVGGVVGAGVFYAIHAVRHQKMPVMKKMGKVISEMGEMLENYHENSESDRANDLDKSISQGTDVGNSLADWLNNGLALWKTFKKGEKT